MGRRQLRSLTLIIVAFLTYSVTGTSLDIHSQGAEKLNARWKDRTIQVGLSASMFGAEWRLGSRREVEDAVRNALVTWERAADVSFELIISNEESVSPKGLSGDGISLITSAASPRNVLLFEGENRDLPAVTRIFFDTSGFISEVDIVLNPYLRFSADGSPGSYDLRSVMTHEIGHLIGVGHSFVHGAVMYPHTRMNDASAGRAISNRELTVPDISAAREIYGPGTETALCCGSIAGKIAFGNKPAQHRAQIWAESVSDGDVRASSVSDTEGDFLLGGLEEGEYKVYARSVSSDGRTGYVVELGEIRLGLLEEVTLHGGLPSKEKLEPIYFGAPGILSDLPVNTTASRAITILVGGADIETPEYTLQFATRSISASNGPPRFFDYGEGVTVFSRELRVGSSAAPGVYSIIIGDAEIGPRALVGAIRITE